MCAAASSFRYYAGARLGIPIREGWVPEQVESAGTADPDSDHVTSNNKE